MCGKFLKSTDQILRKVWKCTITVRMLVPVRDFVQHQVLVINIISL